MSWKVKAIVGAFVLIVAGGFVLHRARAWPALPNSPVPLGELIDKSDLIVQAKVVKVENATARVYSGTNRWILQAIKAVGAQDRDFVTAHLEVLQGVKGPSVDRVLIDYPIGLATPPPVESDQTIVAFAYRQRGAYHPVAYSYGTRVLSRKDGEVLLRRVAEFVATEKMRSSERERSRAEWLVKLIETPEMRWDGAASWVYANDKPSDAVKKLSADLVKRVEAVAFRDEPLAEGDELLLQELAATQRRKVVRRLLRYFEVAKRSPIDDTDILKQPWRCHGAMQLLVRVAKMPEAFKKRLDRAPYPDMSTSMARRDFINAYLPEIQERLKAAGLLD
ncbi:MAG TPA: hypothetical protein VM680_08950 [Verrucomicrobiae bacterium]|nr:hypothetical protein [Verrucomicrobiae bacterium]